MNYTQSLEYLENIYKSNSQRNMQSLLKVLDKLGNPQDKLKVIHVAGTNGKGSTCAMLTSILIEAGYKVGTFTSPHLETYNERITINNIMISDEDLANQISLVEETVKLTETSLSFFEVFTVATYNYLFKQQVDIAIIEVGLGGRLDCTNVVKSPILSVITSISYDHMKLLGNTLEQITKEKAGIIKKNCPVVLYSAIDKVYNVVYETAMQNNSKLYHLKWEDFSIDIKQLTVEQTNFSITSRFFNYNDLTIRLLGKYQIYNASNLLLCIYALKQAGIIIEDKALKQGLLKAKWAGRMEVVQIAQEMPPIILDGAHNYDGVLAYCQSMKEYFKHKNITLVVGFLGDKQFDKMLRSLALIANTIILTEPNNKRALSADVLYETFKTFEKEIKEKKHIIIQKDYKNAINTALDITLNSDIISVVGSLYLVGDVKAYLAKGWLIYDRFQGGTAKI